MAYFFPPDRAIMKIMIMIKNKKISKEKTFIQINEGMIISGVYLEFELGGY